MHEASIAKHIIEQLTARIAEGTLPARLETIHLKIGKLTAVVPENLAFMFEVLSADTVLSGVKLVQTEVPVMAECRACAASFEIGELDFHCRSCGSADLSIVSGRELLIDSVEVPDE